MATHAENETGAPQPVVRHPLDALTAGDVEETTRILRASGRITPRVRIMAYSLLEPDKDVVLAYQPGQPVPREVFVIMRDHERRLTIEAVVSLAQGTIRAFRERQDVQPALTYPEVFAAQQAVLGCRFPGGDAQARHYRPLFRSDLPLDCRVPGSGGRGLAGTVHSHGGHPVRGTRG